MLFIGTEIFASILLASTVPEEILGPDPVPVMVQQEQQSKREKQESSIVPLPNKILIEGFYYYYEDAIYFYDRYWKRRYPKHQYYIKDGKRHHRITTPVRIRFTPAFQRFPKPKDMGPKKGPPRRPGMRPGKGPPRKPGVNRPPRRPR